MFERIVYIGIYITLFVLAFFYKKTEQKENGFVWLIVTGFSIRIYHAFVYFFLHVLSIGYHLWIVTLLDAMLAVFLGYLVIKKGQRQNYVFLQRDAVLLILTLFFWVIFVLKYYGVELSLRFGSVDPALHAQYAKTMLVAHDSVTNMYFSSLNTAIWMDLVEPIVQTINLYRVFVFANALDFLYTALMFYALVRKYAKNLRGQVLLAVLLGLYSVAYPFYTTIFGFSYYTTAIILINLILFLVPYYEQYRKSSYFLFLLNASLFAIFTSYTLFVPMVFLALFFAILWRIYRKKKHLSKETIKELLALFLLPSAFGLVLSVANITELQPGAGISAEGGAYMDMYSNFILFSPVCLLGMKASLKEKKELFSLLLFGISFFITLLMFYLGVKDYVSAYYMSKMYNLLWLLFYYFVGKHMIELAQTKPFEAFLPLLPYAICFSIYTSKIDAFGVQHIPPYVKVSSSAFLNIYENNHVYLTHWGKMDINTIAFLQYVEKNYADEKKSNIISVGDEGWSKWSDFFVRGNDRYVHTGYVADVKSKIDVSSQYICVINGGLDYDIRKNLDSLGTIVYETEIGYVVQLK